MKKWHRLLFLPLMMCVLSSQAALRYKRFSVGFEGGLFKQVNHGTTYTTIDTRTDITIPPFGVTKQIEPSYRFSGGLQMAYRLHSSFDVGFSAFINDHKKAEPLLAAKLGQHLDVLLSPADWSTDAANAADSAFTYRTNSYDIHWGYWFRPTPQMRVHPYLGMHIANIKETQLTHYYDVDNKTNDETIFEEASVLGMGPSIGVDIAYAFHPRFSWITHMRLALLLGHIKSHDIASSTSSSDELSDFTSRTDDSLFEGLNLKLGLSYHYETRNVRSEWQLGYRVTKYLGSTAGLSFIASSHEGLVPHFFENSGFSGPFLSLLVHI